MKIKPLNKLIILLLFPLFSYGQYNEIEDTYFFFNKGVDVRNTFFEGVAEKSGYNGVFKIGYKAQWFQVDMFYETYKAIEYESVGINLYGFMNYNKRFRQGGGIQISTVHRPFKIVPALALNGVLEYHIFKYLAFALRLESKLRSEYEPTTIVTSGYAEIIIKL